MKARREVVGDLVGALEAACALGCNQVSDDGVVMLTQQEQSRQSRLNFALKQGV